ncbi:MAG: hypothetical protein ACTSQ6_09970 [Candidatus Heimdallarchaeaceae archaeon]
MSENSNRKTVRIPDGIMIMMNELVDAGIVKDYSEAFRAGIRSLYRENRDLIDKLSNKVGEKR